MFMPLNASMNRWRTDRSKGLGIALVAAQKAEIPVVLIDNSEAGLQKGLKFAGRPISSLASVPK